MDEDQTVVRQGNRTPDAELTKYESDNQAIHKPILHAA
jgi:hypothetical protein